MIRRIREFMFNILQELQNYHGGLCNTLTRGILPVAHAQHGFAAPTPIGLRSKQLEQQQRIPSCPTAPPVVQLAQIRSQNRRSPSGPGTRAARSHGSQPKQVIWLKAYAVCPEGPSAAAPSYLVFCRQLEAQSMMHTHSKYRASLKGLRSTDSLMSKSLYPSFIPPNSKTANCYTTFYQVHEIPPKSFA